MSIRQMSQVWEHPAVQDGTTLLVLLALADWANDEGYCWPGMAKIAKRAKISERQVRRIIEKLNAVILPNGYRLIEIEENRGRKGGTTYNTNRYKLNLTSCPVSFGLIPVTGDLENLTSEPVKRTFGTGKPDTAMSDEPSRTTTKNQPPTEPSTREFNPTEVGFQLAAKLQLNGMDMKLLCVEAVETAIRELTLSPVQARNEILARWRQYEASDVEFKVGLIKYLKTSLFAKKVQETKPIPKFKTIAGGK